MAQKSARGSSAEPDLFSGKLPLPVAKQGRAPRRERRTPEPEIISPKTAEAFKTISETAKMLSLPQHVLRFWESKFAQIKPLKLRGGRRYYRPQDIDTLFAIKHLLYKEGYTIKGARRAFGQVKKQKAEKEMVMADASARKKRKSGELEDTPLFSTLLPAQEAPAKPVAKREELKRIHEELLEMRDLLASLPVS